MEKEKDAPMTINFIEGDVYTPTLDIILAKLLKGGRIRRSSINVIIAYYKTYFFFRYHL